MHDTSFCLTSLVKYPIPNGLDFKNLLAELTSQEPTAIPELILFFVDMAAKNEPGKQKIG